MSSLGHSWKKGPMTKEHKRKAVLGRKKKAKRVKCEFCDQEYLQYSSKQRFCGQDCADSATMDDWTGGWKDNPLQYKARSLAGSLRLGKGKTDKMIALLTIHVGRPCKYCGQEITFENASVDHKEPRINSRVNGNKKNRYSKEELYHVDRIENLQIICRGCNMLKGEFSDQQYSKLLKFLDQDPQLRKAVLKRFTRSFLFFGAQRGPTKWRS